MNNNFVKETFLRLTSKTYPFGYESDVLTDVPDLPPLQEDGHGNWFIKIGESRTMFTCHLDTACKDQVEVGHVFEDEFIKTDGKSILGADDKAGMTILLYLIKNNVPGLYYFFFGEEVGCIGSGLASERGDFKGNYDRCVAFDRRGTDSIITYQSSSRCCSDDFAKHLKDQFEFLGMKYKLDDGGIYTDSAEFTKLIPECTNISVGYYNEHTHSEKQNIVHLEQLAEVAVKVDWENLVTVRDPEKTEVKKWTSTYYQGGNRYVTHDDWDEYNAGGTQVPSTTRTTRYDGFRDDSWKGTRRSGKKNKRGREYYDGGDGEMIPIINNKIDMKSLPASNFDTNKSKIYDFLKDKFLDSRFTEEEVEIVKSQYIDLGSSEDVKAFERVKDYMTISPRVPETF